MATAKKPTTTRKKPAATTHKSPARTTKKAAPRSAFMTMQPTVETVYWAIFGVAILALGIWVLTLTMKVNAIYDQIDVNNAMSDSMQMQPVVKAKTD